VVVIDEEKEKGHKKGYIPLYTKLFRGGDVYISKMRKQNNKKKIEKPLYTYDKLVMIVI
jgi:hypothetical protein